MPTKIRRSFLDKQINYLEAARPGFKLTPVMRTYWANDICDENITEEDLAAGMKALARNPKILRPGLADLIEACNKPKRERAEKAWLNVKRKESKESFDEAEKFAPEANKEKLVMIRRLFKEEISFEEYIQWMKENGWKEEAEGLEERHKRIEEKKSKLPYRPVGWEDLMADFQDKFGKKKTEV